MKYLLLLAFMTLSGAAQAENPCRKWMFTGYSVEAEQTTLGTYQVYAAAMTQGDHLRAMAAMKRVYGQARQNPASTASALCLMGEDPTRFVTAAKLLVEAPQTVRAPVEAQRPLTCLKMDSDLSICN